MHHSNTCPPLSSQVLQIRQVLHESRHDLRKRHEQQAVDLISVSRCIGLDHTSTEAAVTQTQTDRQTRHNTDTTQPSQVQSHKLVVNGNGLGSFSVVKHMLHIGKVKVVAGRSTEDVENVAARCFKVARRVVGRRNVDLSFNVNKISHQRRLLTDACQLSTMDSIVQKQTNQQ